MQIQLPETIRERMKTMPMPVQYDQACKALIACETIDEAKFYANKADALAAWAKINKSNDAEVAAQRIKLFSYRRMSELADEIAGPGKGRGRHGRSPGNAPIGQRQLLRGHGFRNMEIDNIRKVGTLEKKAFDAFMASPRPPPMSHIHDSLAQSSIPWREFSRRGGGLRSFCRSNAAKECARELLPREVAAARAMAIELQEWIDEFERFLPKDIPQR